MKCIQPPLLPLIVVLALAACNESRESPQAGPERSLAGDPSAERGGEAAASPGKPTAPIDIRYNVIGAAFVGQPVNIEIDVSSKIRDRPIALEYRINDPRDLAFDESQPRRVALSAIGEAPSAKRQVTVLPQREGRLYLNVSAEIETAEGTMIKAIAVPLQVGKARAEPAGNGELKRDQNGDHVMSMPAEETP